MAKVGIFAGKGVGRDANDTKRLTVYLTRKDHAAAKRLLLDLEDHGLHISMTELACAALQRAVAVLKSSPPPPTTDDALDLIRKP